MKHSLRDIENAFRFVSSAPVDENQAILNVSTGEILCKSGMLDEEEFPEEVEASDNYVWIPHRDDLDLGAALVFEFVDERLPGEKKAVKRMFRRKGAYPEFLELLERTGTLDQWIAFEKEETKNALLDWCDENEIEVEGEF